VDPFGAFLIKPFRGPKVSNCLNLWTQKVQLFDFKRSLKTNLKSPPEIKMKKQPSKKKLGGPPRGLFNQTF